MLWKTYKILIIVFVLGLAWEFYSDLVFSSIEKEMSAENLEILRSINNFILFSITALVLSLQIRKQQRKLSLSEEQYRNIFYSNPNPMWVYNKTTLCIIAVNDAAIVKYGYSKSDFLKMTIRDIRPADDYDLLDKTIENDDPGLRELGIWRHIKKNGEVFSVSIVSHEVFFDKQLCKLVMVTDVTDKNKDEQKLRNAYQKEKELNEKLAHNYALITKAQEEGMLMAQVINKINNLVLIVDEKGIISWVNKAFSDFTGYSVDNVMGKRPGEILHGPKTDSNTVHQAIDSIQKKEPYGAEIVNYKKNGELYWTQLSISPIFDEEKNFCFLVTVQNVITERKEKEQKILAQHAALQEIAWANSHELRRPVSSILGLISIIKDTENEDEIKQCIALLETCSKELDLLLKGINQKIQYLELDESLKT